MQGTEGFLKKYGRLIILIALLVGAVILIWYAFGDSIPAYYHLLSEGDEQEIESYVSHTAQWKGVLTMILLSAMQVVSIVFPGFAIQIAAGAIFGWWKALLMCYSGFLLGNLGVFRVARRMGSEIAGFTPKKKPRNTWMRTKMRGTRPSFVVGLLNLIPLVPNGIVPYMAAGSSITTGGFIGAIMATSWLQILFNTLAGNFLKNGQYFFMVLAIGFQVILVIVVAKNRQKIMAWLPGGGDRDDEDEIELPRSVPMKE